MYLVNLAARQRQNGHPYMKVFPMNLLTFWYSILIKGYVKEV